MNGRRSNTYGFVVVVVVVVVEDYGDYASGGRPQKGPFTSSSISAQPRPNRLAEILHKIQNGRAVSFFNSFFL